MRVRDVKTGRFVKNSPDVHARLDAVWRFVKPQKHNRHLLKLALIYGAYVMWCLLAGMLGGFLGAKIGLN